MLCLEVSRITFLTSAAVEMVSFGAELSEHGKANALDVASVKLGSGTVLGLTDLRVAKNFREGLRQATCARFSTVLGPGSDGQHENHIHVDMIERRNGYRICQWDLRDLSDDTAEVMRVPYPRPRPTNVRDTSRREIGLGEKRRSKVYIVDRRLLTRPARL